MLEASFVCFAARKRDKKMCKYVLEQQAFRGMEGRKKREEKLGAPYVDLSIHLSPFFPLTFLGHVASCGASLNS